MFLDQSCNSHKYHNICDPTCDFWSKCSNDATKWNDVKIMHQIFMFLRGFSQAHKNCKKLFSDKILYRWYKYIISLQNHLIKLTPNVLIKTYRLYTWHVHRSWWFRHLLQSEDIDINNWNIFVFFLNWNLQT